MNKKTFITLHLLLGLSPWRKNCINTTLVCVTLLTNRHYFEVCV